MVGLAVGQAERAFLQNRAPRSFLASNHLFRACCPCGSEASDCVVNSNTVGPPHRFNLILVSSVDRSFISLCCTNRERLHGNRRIRQAVTVPMMRSLACRIDFLFGSVTGAA